jgi:hypothetical protein
MLGEIYVFASKMTFNVAKTLDGGGQYCQIESLKHYD